MSHVARTLCPTLLLALVFSLVASNASAGDQPAVREANVRISGDYTWNHFFADDVFFGAKGGPAAFVPE